MTFVTEFVLVDQVNGRRSASPVKTEPTRKNSSPSRAARQPPQQQQQLQEDDGNSMSTPVRVAPAPSAPLAKQLSTGKLDKGKFANFQRNDSNANVVDAALKRKTSSDNNSSEYTFFLND